ncbi:MAG: hypothetical protein M3Y72_12260 [Acidobacteriota bacterium]|nr:hypothetical protein [Acidobacteriota bacterium]
MQSNRPWPLIFHFFGQETARKIHPWGFTAEFSQPAEQGGPNYEFVAAQETGCLRVLETEGLLMAGNDVFYYDQAIGTALDVLEFAARFFRNIALGEAKEISIRLEWGGLKGRRIGAAQVAMLPSYEQRISQTDVTVSEIRFPLADAEKDVPAKIERLLTRVFNQFGMFHKSDIYQKIIDQWKSGQ